MKGLNMSWQEKMKEWGGGEVSFLSVDGETVLFVVVGEPFLIEGKFKGQETQRIGCPIITIEGFSLLVVGKRVARRLSKYEKFFKKYGFELIRRGGQDDPTTRYELNRIDDEGFEKELLEIAASSDWSEDIQDAVQSAIEIAAG